MVKSKAVFLLLSAVLLLAGLMSVSVAFAGQVVEDDAYVFDKFSGEVVEGAYSHLVRKDDEISFVILTYVEPEHAYTVWMKIHEPEGTIVLHAAGIKSDKKGKAAFAGALHTGPITDADGEIVKNSGDGNFDTPFTSKVTLVIRDHGP